MKVINLFNRREKQKIQNAISEAELVTSGEIRVHLENHCPDDVLERAKLIFEQLQMDQTADKNGVLIYLAIQDRKFAVLGDKGIDTNTPSNFWEAIKEDMRVHFKEGEFTTGIINAIQEIGKKLALYFPYQSDDINELPNEISFNDN